jgi:flagellar biosynthesis protein FliQ
MNASIVIDIGREALLTVLLISGPLLLAGLIVGLAVGVFQAVTQIHEMTLTFIPKILAIFGMLLLLMPWMIIKLIDFVTILFTKIPYLIR